ncbi:putative Nucleolar complex protein 2 [Cocos nucifera]|nr:putative Nucleolar complex protein 2 [Cocos nucifera]
MDREMRKEVGLKMIGKKAYQKVYDWQFIFCLELWTGVICAYSSEDDFRPLAYPLTQIIYGVASLVLTARYFPLRLRCVRMLNRIAGATGTFVPVSSLLLGMLEMKELKRPPTGGVGKAVNLPNVKQVDKTTLKTRGFQEACIYSVVEELAEHLSQWSYSVAFFELSFIPVVQLRNFCKYTKADRFRREIKELIRQVEANCDFTNSKRIGIEFSPSDPAAASFLKAEKESGSSPLSKFVANLHLKAQQRVDSMVESRLSEMREQDDDDGDAEEGAAVFSSSWLPEKKSKVRGEKKRSKKRSHEKEQDVGADEDVVEDLVLSSDDDEAPVGGLPSDEEDHESESPSLKQEGWKRKLATSPKQKNKKHKLATASSKNRSKPRIKKAARRGANK